METKEEDFIEDLFIGSTHNDLLFFTNAGRVHWLKVYEIPEAGRQARGKSLANLLSLAEGEKVAATVAVKDFEADGFLFFATKQGKVKKTDLEAYSHPRAGGIIAISLDEGDELISVGLTDGQQEIFLGTKEGMTIRFHEEDVRPMGRAAAGVRGIDLVEGDHVVRMEVVREGAAILTVTERGFGKRTPTEEYRLQGRGGRGVIDIKAGERNGPVVALAQVRAEDEILVVTTKGMVIRLPVAECRLQGRNTLGVRIINLEADDRVGSIARVESDRG
jgi:DNA gyrase subunit A